MQYRSNFLTNLLTDSTDRRNRTWFFDIFATRATQDSKDSRQK